MNYFDLNPYAVCSKSPSQALQIKTAFAKIISDAEHNLRVLAAVDLSKPFGNEEKSRTDKLFPKTSGLSLEQWSRLIDVLNGIHVFASHYYRNSDFYLDQDLIDTLFPSVNPQLSFKTKDKRTFFARAEISSLFVSKNSVISLLNNLQPIEEFHLLQNENPEYRKRILDTLYANLPPSFIFKGQSRIESFTEIPVLLTKLDSFFLKREKICTLPAPFGEAPSFTDIIRRVPSLKGTHQEYFDLFTLRNLCFHGFWPGETFNVNGADVPFDYPRIAYVLKEWSEKLPRLPGNYYLLKESRIDIASLRRANSFEAAIKKSFQIECLSAFEEAKLNERLGEITNYCNTLFGGYKNGMNKDAEACLREACSGGIAYEYNPNSFKDGIKRSFAFQKLRILHFVSDNPISVNGSDSGRREFYLIDVRTPLGFESSINSVPFSKYKGEKKETNHPYCQLEEIRL